MDSLGDWAVVLPDCYIGLGMGIKNRHISLITEFLTGNFRAICPLLSTDAWES